MSWDRVKGYVRHKALNPRAWGRSVSCVVVWSTVISFAIGAGVTWWFGRSWIEFGQMQAYYVRGDPAIYVSGLFQVNRECRHSAGWRLLDLLRGKDRAAIELRLAEQIKQTQQELADADERGDDTAVLSDQLHALQERLVPPKVVWRVEALATDGQIALYGPQPILPPMNRGEHEYKETLPLLAEITPDGWKVTVIATCTIEIGQQTIASDPTRVRMINPERPIGGGL